MADSVPTYRDLTTNLTLQWVDTEDVQATQRALIEVTPGAAFLELPRGRRGEKGDPGAVGPGFWFRGLVTDQSELPQNLGPVDRGSAYPNTRTRSLHVWDGNEWSTIPDFVGVAGEPGKTPRPQVGSVVPGVDAEVSVNAAASTEDVFVLDFVLPQGPAGPPGEPGPEGNASDLSSSPDVDLTRAPVVGEALTWTGAKWAPRTSQAPVGPWMLGPEAFTPHSQGLIGSDKVQEKIICTYTLPGMPFDWRPVVIGGNLALETPLGVQFNADVRIGNAQKGDIVGHAVGKKFQRTDDLMPIHPWSTATASPSSAYGVVKANSATTVYVVLSKVAGSIGAWSFTRQNAGLTFMAMPVNSSF